MLDDGQTYKGRAYMNSVETGVLTENVYDREGIVFVREIPSFELIRDLRHARAVVCTKEISQMSHEYELLRDNRVPLLHRTDSDIERLLGETVLLQTSFSEMRGQLSMLSGDKPILVEDSKKDRVWSSSKRGMNYNRERELARKIFVKGEFLLMPELEEHPRVAMSRSEGKTYLREVLASTLEFGISHFNRVVYRLTDFTKAHLAHLDPCFNYEDRYEDFYTGNRGAKRLLDSDSDLLDLQLGALSDMSKGNDRLHMLIPYPRSIEEAVRLKKRISRFVQNVPIGSMIETPVMLRHGKELRDLFGFFYIGADDLYRGFTGADRRNPELSEYDKGRNMLINSIAEFIKSINIQTSVYTGVRRIYSALVRRTDIPNPDRIKFVYH